MSKNENYEGERVITCPICFNDEKCFEDMHGDFSSYLCFRCGYTSNSHYTKDSAERAKHIGNTPELIKGLEFFDNERELYWYPSVLNMGTKVIIFPEGKEDNWVWKYAKVIDIPEDEKKDYPVPGKDGEFYDTKLDVDGAESFDKYDFLSAVKGMGITVDL